MNDVKAIMRKFLELVGNLHDRGYEQLRIVPSVQDRQSAMWACNLAPKSKTLKSHGAWTLDGNDYPYFFFSRHVPYSPWETFADQTLDEAADFFIKRETELAKLTRGQDKAYVAWYKSMLELTAPLGVVSSVERHEGLRDCMYVGNVDDYHIVVPLPPGGDMVAA